MLRDAERKAREKKKMLRDSERKARETEKMLRDWERMAREKEKKVRDAVTAAPRDGHLDPDSTEKQCFMGCEEFDLCVFGAGTVESRSGGCAALAYGSDTVNVCVD